MVGIVVAIILVSFVAMLYACVVVGKRRDIQEQEYWERKNKK